MRSLYFKYLAIVCVLLTGKVLADAPKPVLVVDYYPNKMDRGVLDWDSPVFAAYKDGVVIWRKNWKSSVEALATTKSENAATASRRLEKLVALYGNKTFTLTSATDYDVTVVWCSGTIVKILGNWKAPHVVGGDDLERAERYARVNENERQLWSQFPIQFRDALTELETFDDVDGKSWLPEKLEVTLHPGGAALKNEVNWPEQWPKSFAALSKNSNIKMVEMPGTMLDELLSTVADNGEPRAVMLGEEKKYAKIRFIFPGESSWRNDISQRD